MKSQVIYIFTVLLMGFWCLVFAKFHHHFNNPDIYQEQISYLKDEVAHKELKNELLKDQHIQFQMDVARVLPQALKQSPTGEKSYPLRALASLVLAKDHKNFKESSMKRDFQRAKKLFRDKQFGLAARAFVEFIDKNPFSMDINEAFFLLSESYFQMDDYERCLTTVEKMIELFPESELTGYAMIRMGKIYEYQERPEEAVDIYQTVLLTFPERGIASQARKSLQSVEL
ncbi:MAG: tetratricopeptide repeat protein [Bdellovibrionales bacterium]|nr:tetratricopeptide repeat protein [Bdellovibrionales bacterium]